VAVRKEGTMAMARGKVSVVSVETLTCSIVGTESAWLRSAPIDFRLFTSTILQQLPDRLHVGCR
jgi:hypothetical protein